MHSSVTKATSPLQCSRCFILVHRDPRSVHSVSGCLLPRPVLRVGMQVADDRAHRHRQCPVCGGRRGERKGGWYLLDHLLRRQLLTGAVYKAAHPKNDRVCLHCYKRCTRPAHPTTFLAAESADHQCHVCHTQSAGSWHKLESFDVCDLCHAPRNCSWKDRQWVEECATRYGRGIRATRHIPAPSTASIVAEIHGCPLTELEYKALSDDEYAYVIDTSLVDGQARWFNLRQHWLGLLNHALLLAATCASRA